MIATPHATPHALLDNPLALEIAWSRLVTVVDEMQSALRRTAFSTIVGAANDLGCDILDARGWLIAHATTSNPAFNLTLPSLVRNLNEIFPPESLRPGDVLITNDPWLVVGHLPDFAVVTPIFKHDRVVGFSGSIAHVADIGGLLDTRKSRSVYEEGLQIPPTKLFDQGVKNETLVNVIARNVRTPEMTIGDMMALVTANEVAARQTVALIDEYGFDDLAPLSDAIQSRAEQAMRRAIAQIPDGTYGQSLEFDEIDELMSFDVEVRVSGSDMVVEFLNVPPQHPFGGINSTLNYTLARVAYAINCFLTPQLPSNEGLFRPIEVRIPEGSILNCRYPASVVDRTKSGWHVTTAIQGAFAKALPDQIPAPSGFKSLAHVMGVDDRGRTFRTLMFNGAGMGAGRETDGAESVCYPTSSCNVPIELVEETSSVLTLEKELIADSGGAGQYRGGSGVRVTVRPVDGLEHPLTFFVAPHHQDFPPFGLRGGRAAEPTHARLNGQLLTAKETREQLIARVVTDSSTTITVETTGGGGYGDPRMRDAWRVLRDVRNGLVSQEAARDVYGLDIDLETLTARPIDDARVAAANAARGGEGMST